MAQTPSKHAVALEDASPEPDEQAVADPAESQAEGGEEPGAHLPAFPANEHDQAPGPPPAHAAALPAEEQTPQFPAPGVTQPRLPQSKGCGSVGTAHEPAAAAEAPGVPALEHTGAGVRVRSAGAEAPAGDFAAGRRMAAANPVKAAVPASRASRASRTTITS